MSHISHQGQVLNFSAPACTALLETQCTRYAGRQSTSEQRPAKPHCALPAQGRASDRNRRHMWYAARCSIFGLPSPSRVATAATGNRRASDITPIPHPGTSPSGAVLIAPLIPLGRHMACWPLRTRSDADIMKTHTGAQPCVALWAVAPHDLNFCFGTTFGTQAPHSGHRGRHTGRWLEGGLVLAAGATLIPLEEAGLVRGAPEAAHALDNGHSRQEEEEVGND